MGRAKTSVCSPRSASTEQRLCCTVRADRGYAILWSRVHLRPGEVVIKVAMIGAGSVVFSKNLTGDILSYPEFKDATFSYMDIDEERLDVGANLCRKVGKTLDANPKINATRDRREALRGADFVINMVQIGGIDS